MNPIGTDELHGYEGTLGKPSGKLSGKDFPIHPSALAHSAPAHVQLMLAKTSSGQFMPHVGHKLAAVSAALRAGPEAVVEMAASGSTGQPAVRFQLRHINGVLHLGRANRESVEVNFQNPAFLHLWDRLAVDVRWAIVSGSTEHATLWNQFPHLPRDLNSLEEILRAAESDPGEPLDAPAVLPWDATPVAKALFRDAQLRKQLVEPNFIFDYHEDDLRDVFINDPDAKFINSSVAKLKKDLKSRLEENEAQGIAKINDPRFPRYLNVVTGGGQVSFYDAEGNLISPSLLERIPLQYLHTAGRRTFASFKLGRRYLKDIPYDKDVERLTPTEAARLIYTGHVGDVVEVGFHALPTGGPPRSLWVSRNVVRGRYGTNTYGDLPLARGDMTTKDEGELAGLTSPTEGSVAELAHWITNELANEALARVGVEFREPVHVTIKRMRTTGEHPESVGDWIELRPEK